MKKIALDLDGVVFDSENLYRVYAEMYDVDYFKRDSLINNSKRMFQERYNWEKQQFTSFYEKYAIGVLSTANLMTGVNIVLPKLVDNFEFIVVTSRNDEEVELARRKLEDIGLKEIKIFNKEGKKIDRLIKEKVDYIIDDDEEICRLAAMKQIHALYFKNAASDKIEESEFLTMVNNWGEIYKFLQLNGGMDGD